MPYLFAFFRETYVKAMVNESPNDRNDRGLFYAATNVIIVPIFEVQQYEVVPYKDRKLLDGNE